MYWRKQKRERERGGRGGGIDETESRIRRGKGGTVCEERRREGRTNESLLRLTVPRKGEESWFGGEEKRGDLQPLQMSAADLSGRREGRRRIDRGGGGDCAPNMLLLNFRAKYCIRYKKTCSKCSFENMKTAGKTSMTPDQTLFPGSIPCLRKKNPVQ